MRKRVLLEELFFQVDSAIRLGVRHPEPITDEVEPIWPSDPLRRSIALAIATLLTLATVEPLLVGDPRWRGRG